MFIEFAMPLLVASITHDTEYPKYSENKSECPIFAKEIPPPAKKIIKDD